MIKDYYYFLDNRLDIAGYYNQFDRPDKLEVGKVYYQHSGIYWQHYLIVYVGHGVALGVEVNNGNGNSNVGEKELFYAEGILRGFKYNDARRPCYRLRYEVIKK